MTPEELAKLYHETFQRLGPTVYGPLWNEYMAQSWEEMDVRVKQLNIAVAAEILANKESNHDRP